MKYYGQKTRNEYRITRFGRDFPFFQDDNVGDLLVIAKFTEEDYKGYVLSTDEDIDALRETKYGKIALGLLQVGEKDRAELYLKYLSTPKVTDRTLHAINSIATAYGLPRVSIQASSLIQDRGILEIDDNIIF